jgi:hypothetical protein
VLVFCSASLFNDQNSTKKFEVPLVTGCGRSGTHSTAKSLSHCCHKTLHEDFPTSEGTMSVCWFYANGTANLQKDQYPMEKYTRYDSRIAHLKKFSPVVLQVRDPINVISSVRRCFCANGVLKGSGIKWTRKSWETVEMLLPNFGSYFADDKTLNWVDVPYNDTRRAMVYWYGWNRLVEITHFDELANATMPLTDSHVIRLEDKDMLLKAAELLGLSPEEVTSASSAIERTAAASQKKELPDLTWKELHETAPMMAQLIWKMGQRYGYNKDEPKDITKYLAKTITLS